MGTLEITDCIKKYPAAAALEVTLRCNMKCLHCGSSADGHARENELSLDEWKGVVDELKELGSEFITLSGGEPFIWPHWRELAAYIAGKGVALSMISNGSCITKDDVAFLRANNMRNIGLSLDGTRTTHDHIRQVDGAFDRVMQTISMFRDAEVRVGVSTSVNKLNFGELEELKNILQESGIKMWQVQVVNSFGRAATNKDQMRIDHQQYKELVEFIFRAQEDQKSGRTAMRTVPADSVGYCHSLGTDVWEDLEWQGCNAGLYVLGIKSDGDVLGCLSLQDPQFIGGNVRKRSLTEIWNDDDAFWYTRKFTEEKLCGACGGCSAGDQCRSGCLAMGYSVSGEMYNNSYCYKYISEKNINLPSP